MSPTRTPATDPIRSTYYTNYPRKTQGDAERHRDVAERANQDAARLNAADDMEPFFREITCLPCAPTSSVAGADTFNPALRCSVDT